jgi:hypothetical protein
MLKLPVQNFFKNGIHDYFTGKYQVMDEESTGGMVIPMEITSL